MQTQYFHCCANARRILNYINIIHINVTLLKISSRLRMTTSEKHTPQSPLQFLATGSKLSSQSLTASPYPRTLSPWRRFVRRSWHLTGRLSGPDGFPMCFCQQLWCVISKDISITDHDFTHRSKNLNPINFSWLFLILKQVGTTDINNFRPISSQTALTRSSRYVWSTTFVKHFQEIIDPARTAFLAGRNILDSVALAEEIMFHLKETKSEGMILKINFHNFWQYQLELPHRLPTCPWFPHNMDRLDWSLPHFIQSRHLG